MSNKQVPNDGSMMSPGSKYNSDNVESQPRDPLWTEPDAVPDSYWNTMFVIACVIAVSLDPLFFYIPVINEKKKCLAVDIELMTIALTLRSLTDVTFVVNIIYHVCKAINDAYKEPNNVLKGKKSDELAPDSEFSKVLAAKIIPFAKLVAGKLAWRSTLTSILAVFPMPQLLLVFVFLNMRGHGYLQRKKILNVFLLAQYLPRIYRIYLSSQKLRQTTGIWAKALFNFFLYILASHVLGAFWYFFSIQRETSCWHQACVKHVEGCMSTLFCEVQNHDTAENHDTAARNAKFLNQFCPISADENAKAHIDFGIFLDSHKNGITGDIDFGTKLSYSFWWGLRNLSNFGTNLETSAYVWENCFAIFISVIGVLLFLYLIGNVQRFMSMEAEKREDIRNKIQLKDYSLTRWMDRNKLPDHLKEEIKENIKQQLKKNKDTDLENLFFTIPMKSLRRFRGMELLKKVPKLARMDDRVLKMMCDRLQPVKYDEDTKVFQMEDPLDRMLLITEGILRTCGTTSNDGPAATENAETGSISGCRYLKKDDFYGAELIDWVTQRNDFCYFPTSNFMVTCHSRVEGFVLKAKDLSTVVSENENGWKIGISKSDNSIV